MMGLGAIRVEELVGGQAKELVLQPHSPRLNHQKAKTDALVSCQQALNRDI